MKIAVIGAGMQGSACAFDLARSEGVEEVHLIDEDESRVQAAAALVMEGAREVGRRPSVRTSAFDVEDGDAVTRALHASDGAVSAVPYFLNVGLSKAAIRAKVSFCDMGGNTSVVQQQLALDGEAKRAGISLIPDCGLAPGLGNILVADAAASFDETHEAHIRVGGLPRHPKRPFNYMLVFSAHGLINEYVGEAIYLKDGSRVAVPALGEIEELRFPDPVGGCEAFATAGGSSTLPWTYEGKIRDLTYKTVRYPGHAGLIRVLSEMGLFSLDPVAIPAGGGTSGRVRVRPRDVTAAVLTRVLGSPGEPDLVVARTTVRGRRSGARVTRVYEMMDFMDEVHGITAMMRTTAYPVAVIAIMQARGEIVLKGAMPPEVAVPPAPFLQALAERGITIRQEETVESAASLRAPR